MEIDVRGSVLLANRGSNPIGRTRHNGLVMNLPINLATAMGHGKKFNTLK